MSGEGNGPTITGKSQKQQGRAPLLFLDHIFASYQTIEWYQWELNVQLLVKGASQLNAANEVGNKVKALLIKLLATHGKDNINMFSETYQRLEVEKFPKIIREVKDLLAYETMEEMATRIGYLMIIHPKRIYCAACQEHLNKALARVTSELDEENKDYFSDYGTMWELANYNVQLKLNTPSNTIGNTKTETTALAVYALQLHAHIA
eukprot:1586391-Ditylum_brightwellii.AAC.1